MSVSTNTPQRLIIKVGTQVLMANSTSHLDYNVIHKIVAQIGALQSAGHEVVLVTSGARGAGWGLPDPKSEKNELLKLKMMTALGQPRLMQLYANFFLEHHIAIGQILVTRADFVDRERYLSIRSVLEGLLKRNLVPIINENDVVAGDALSFGDNDYLSAMVASVVGAHRLFLLTSTNGFYLDGLQENGEVSTQSSPLRQVKKITPQMWEACQPNLSLGGRGGMYSKLKAAEIVCSVGIHAHIAHGKEDNVLLEILQGKAVGTHFVPWVKRMRSYRRWLRFGPLTSGALYIDEGAESALQTDKSLLTKGILSIEGDFIAGQVVELYSPKQKKLGVGVVDWSAEQIRSTLNGEPPNVTKDDLPSWAVHHDRLLLFHPDTF